MIAARELLDMSIGQIRTLRAFLSEQLDEGEGSESETAETRTCNEILAYLSVLLQRLEATGPHIADDQGFWLFREFKDARPGEMPSLPSDHPNDQKRIDALTQHFAANPAVFSRFSQDPSSAHAFAAEKNTPVVFLR
jgi:hypothetical protein